ncbi:protein YgfX [Pontibacter sp. JAM-7]|uniref:protein YgfX n=1 Tax=Pontibacter sp. JAM-7 TaxID=3366581 RepID=UPI003AF48820
MFSLDRIRLTPSRFAAGLHLLFHLLAAYAVVVTRLPPVGKGVLLMGICVLALYSWRKDVSLSASHAITSLRWLPDQGLMVLGCNSGRSCQAEAIRASLVTPFLVLFAVSVPGQLLPLTVFIFKDSCSQDTFRRLRVLARFAKLVAERN